MNLNYIYTDCRNTLEGLGYTGNISTTISGRECQRWDAQEPHKHPYKTTFDERYNYTNQHILLYPSSCMNSITFICMITCNNE